MNKRPIPILVALLHHALACVYAISKIPQAINAGAFGVGQMLGLVVMASGFFLLLVKPNAGRWLSVAIFAIAATCCFVVLGIVSLQGVPFAVTWKVWAFAAVFVCLGYLLAFGRSTQAYIDAARR